MPRILFLIRSLEMGGAEQQLVSLLRGLDKSRFQATVVTYYSGGSLEEDVRSLEGVRLTSLRKRGRWDLIPFFLRFFRVVRHEQPDVLHGYMLIANELCLMVGRALGLKVVWGLRASDVDYFRYDWIQGWSFRFASLLSRFPDLIIANSQAGRDYCVSRGYSARRMIVIPNGIDTSRFRPDSSSRLQVRAEWGIPESDRVVGLVARLDPIKDHATFLRAAARVWKRHAGSRFVCVGDGPEPYRGQLSDLARELGIESRIVWAGARRDMPAVYPAFDLACLSSASEGYPNVVGEAMASGVPCVVTDAGDAGWIVGDTGIVVAPGDAEALADGMIRMLERPDLPKQGAAARGRICEHFSTSTLAEATQRAIASMLEEAACARC